MDNEVMELYGVKFKPVRDDKGKVVSIYCELAPNTALWWWWVEG
jgi:hypothetical protein